MRKLKRNPKKTGRSHESQPIPAELVSKLLGNRVAVSPIVTVEPRRRKFHKPITLTIPVPQAASKGMINQYSGDAPTLRLLCSITGGTTRAQWEDVTGSTPLTFVNDCVSFTTTVSARFWLMDCRNVGDATKMATELYREAIHVPFMAKFVVFVKRIDVLEARLRIFCMTDDKEDKTLEHQEHFTEVAKSRDVEVLEGKSQYIEFAGNLVPVTKSGDQLKLGFRAFRENRLPFMVKVKDPHADSVGRVLFMREPKVAKGEPPQHPACVLNIVLPENIIPETGLSHSVEELNKFSYLQSSDTSRVDLRLSDISNLLGDDWVSLASELGLSNTEINTIKTDHPGSNAQLALTMLRYWFQQHGDQASAKELEASLTRIGRADIVQQCIPNQESQKTSYQSSRIIKDADYATIKKQKDPIHEPDDHDEKKYTAEEKVVEEEETKKSVQERKQEIEKRLSLSKSIDVPDQRPSEKRKSLVQSDSQTSGKEKETVEEKKIYVTDPNVGVAADEPADLTFEQKRLSFEKGLSLEKKKSEEKPFDGVQTSFDRGDSLERKISLERNVSIDKPGEISKPTADSKIPEDKVDVVKRKASESIKTESTNIIEAEKCLMEQKGAEVSAETEERQLSFQEKRLSFERGLSQTNITPVSKEKTEISIETTETAHKPTAEEVRRNSVLFEGVSQGLEKLDTTPDKFSQPQQDLLSPKIVKTPPPSPAEFKEPAWSNSSSQSSQEGKALDIDGATKVHTVSTEGNDDSVDFDGSKTQNQPETSISVQQDFNKETTSLKPGENEAFGLATKSQVSKAKDPLPDSYLDTFSSNKVNSIISKFETSNTQSKSQEPEYNSRSSEVIKKQILASQSKEPATEVEPASAAASKDGSIIPSRLPDIDPQDDEASRKGKLTASSVKTVAWSPSVLSSSEISSASQGIPRSPEKVLPAVPNQNEPPNQRASFLELHLPDARPKGKDYSALEIKIDSKTSRYESLTEDSKTVHIEREYLSSSTIYEGSALLIEESMISEKRFHRHGSEETTLLIEDSVASEKRFHRHGSEEPTLYESPMTDDSISHHITDTGISLTRGTASSEISGSPRAPVQPTAFTSDTAVDVDIEEEELTDAGLSPIHPDATGLRLTEMPHDNESKKRFCDVATSPMELRTEKKDQTSLLEVEKSDAETLTDEVEKRDIGLSPNISQLPTPSVPSITGEQRYDEASTMKTLDSEVPNLANKIEPKPTLILKSETKPEIQEDSPTFRARVSGEVDNGDEENALNNEKSAADLVRGDIFALKMPIDEHTLSNLTDTLMSEHSVQNQSDKLAVSSVSEQVVKDVKRSEPKRNYSQSETTATVETYVEKTGSESELPSDSKSEIVVSENIYARANTTFSSLQSENLFSSETTSPATDPTFRSDSEILPPVASDLIRDSSEFSSPQPHDDASVSDDVLTSNLKSDTSSGGPEKVPVDKSVKTETRPSNSRLEHDCATVDTTKELIESKSAVENLHPCLKLDYDVGQVSRIEPSIPKSLEEATLYFTSQPPTEFDASLFDKIAPKEPVGEVLPKLDSNFELEPKPVLLGQIHYDEKIGEVREHFPLVSKTAAVSSEEIEAKRSDSSNLEFESQAKNSSPNRIIHDESESKKLHTGMQSKDENLTLSPTMSAVRDGEPQILSLLDSKSVDSDESVILTHISIDKSSAVHTLNLDTQSERELEVKSTDHVLMSIRSSEELDSEIKSKDERSSNASSALVAETSAADGPPISDSVSDKSSGKISSTKTFIEEAEPSKIVSKGTEDDFKPVSDGSEVLHSSLKSDNELDITKISKASSDDIGSQELLTPDSRAAIISGSQLSAELLAAKTDPEEVTSTYVAVGESSSLDSELNKLPETQSPGSRHQVCNSESGGTPDIICSDIYENRTLPSVLKDEGESGSPSENSAEVALVGKSIISTSKTVFAEILSTDSKSKSKPDALSPDENEKAHSISTTTEEFTTKTPIIVPLRDSSSEAFQSPDSISVRKNAPVTSLSLNPEAEFKPDPKALNTADSNSRLDKNLKGNYATTSVTSFESVKVSAVSSTPDSIAMKSSAKHVQATTSTKNVDAKEAFDNDSKVDHVFEEKPVIQFTTDMIDSQELLSVQKLADGNESCSTAKSSGEDSIATEYSSADASGKYVDVHLPINKSSDETEIKEMPVFGFKLENEPGKTSLNRSGSEGLFSVKFDGDTLGTETISKKLSEVMSFEENVLSKLETAVRQTHDTNKTNDVLSSIMNIEETLKTINETLESVPSDLQRLSEPTQDTSSTESVIYLSKSSHSDSLKMSKEKIVEELPSQKQKTTALLTENITELTEVEVEDIMIKKVIQVAIEDRSEEEKETSPEFKLDQDTKSLIDDMMVIKGREVLSDVSSATALHYENREEVVEEVIVPKKTALTMEHHSKPGSDDLSYDSPSSASQMLSSVEDRTDTKEEVFTLTELNFRNEKPMITSTEAATKFEVDITIPEFDSSSGDGNIINTAKSDKRTNLTQNVISGNDDTPSKPILIEEPHTCRDLDFPVKTSTVLFESNLEVSESNCSESLPLEIDPSLRPPPVSGLPIETSFSQNSSTISAQHPSSSVSTSEAPIIGAFDTELTFNHAHADSGPSVSSKNELPSKNKIQIIESSFERSIHSEQEPCSGIDPTLSSTQEQSAEAKTSTVLQSASQRSQLTDSESTGTLFAVTSSVKTSMREVDLENTEEVPSQGDDMSDKLPSSEFHHPRESPNAGLVSQFASSTKTTSLPAHYPQADGENETSQRDQYDKNSTLRPVTLKLEEQSNSPNSSGGRPEEPKIMTETDEFTIVAAHAHHSEATKISCDISSTLEGSASKESGESSQTIGKDNTGEVTGISSTKLSYTENTPETFEVDENTTEASSSLYEKVAPAKPDGIGSEHPKNEPHHLRTSEETLFVLKLDAESQKFTTESDQQALNIGDRTFETTTATAVQLKTETEDSKVLGHSVYQTIKVASTLETDRTEEFHESIKSPFRAVAGAAPISVVSDISAVITEFPEAALKEEKLRMSDPLPSFYDEHIESETIPVLSEDSKVGRCHPDPNTKSTSTSIENLNKSLQLQNLNLDTLDDTLKTNEPEALKSNSGAQLAPRKPEEAEYGRGDTKDFWTDPEIENLIKTDENLTLTKSNFLPGPEKAIKCDHSEPLLATENSPASEALADLGPQSLDKPINAFNYTSNSTDILKRTTETDTTPEVNIEGSAPDPRLSSDPDHFSKPQLTHVKGVEVSQGQSPDFTRTTVTSIHPQSTGKIQHALGLQTGLLEPTLTFSESEQPLNSEITKNVCVKIHEEKHLSTKPAPAVSVKSPEPRLTLDPQTVSFEGLDAVEKEVGQTFENKVVGQIKQIKKDVVLESIDDVLPIKIEVSQDDVVNQSFDSEKIELTENLTQPQKEQSSRKNEQKTSELSEGVVENVKVIKEKMASQLEDENMETASDQLEKVIESISETSVSSKVTYIFEEKMHLKSITDSEKGDSGLSLIENQARSPENLIITKLQDGGKIIETDKSESQNVIDEKNAEVICISGNLEDSSPDDRNKHLVITPANVSEGKIVSTVSADDKLQQKDFVLGHADDKKSGGMASTIEEHSSQPCLCVKESAESAFAKVPIDEEVRISELSIDLASDGGSKSVSERKLTEEFRSSDKVEQNFSNNSLIEEAFNFDTSSDFKIVQGADKVDSHGKMSFITDFEVEPSIFSGDLIPQNDSKGEHLPQQSVLKSSFTEESSYKDEVTVSKDLHSTSTTSFDVQVKRNESSSEMNDFQKTEGILANKQLKDALDEHQHANRTSDDAEELEGEHILHGSSSSKESAPMVMKFIPIATVIGEQISEKIDETDELSSESIDLQKKDTSMVEKMQPKGTYDQAEEISESRIVVFDTKDLESKLIHKDSSGSENSRHISIKCSTDKSIEPEETSQKEIEIHDKSSEIHIPEEQDTIIHQETEEKSTHDENKQILSKEDEVSDFKELESNDIVGDYFISQENQLISVRISHEESIKPEPIALDNGTEEQSLIGSKDAKKEGAIIVLETQLKGTYYEGEHVPEQKIEPLYAKEYESKHCLEDAERSELVSVESSLNTLPLIASSEPTKFSEGSVRIEELSCELKDTKTDQTIKVLDAQYEDSHHKGEPRFLLKTEKIDTMDVEFDQSPQQSSVSEKSELNSAQLATEESIERKEICRKDVKIDGISSEANVTKKEDTSENVIHDKDERFSEQKSDVLAVNEIESKYILEDSSLSGDPHAVAVRHDESIESGKQYTDNRIIEELSSEFDAGKEDDVINFPQVQQKCTHYENEQISGMKIEKDDIKKVECEQSFQDSSISEQSKLISIQYASQELGERKEISRNYTKDDEIISEFKNMKEDTAGKSIHDESKLVSEEKIDTSNVTEFESKQNLEASSILERGSTKGEPFSVEFSHDEFIGPEKISLEADRMDEVRPASEEDDMMKTPEVPQKGIQDDSEHVSEMEINEVSVKNSEIEGILLDHSSLQKGELLPDQSISNGSIELDQISEKVPNINEPSSEAKLAKKQDPFMPPMALQERAQDEDDHISEREIQMFNDTAFESETVFENSLSCEKRELISTELSQVSPTELEKLPEEAGRLAEISSEHTHFKKDDAIIVPETRQKSSHDNDRLPEKKIEQVIITKFEDKQIVENTTSLEKSELSLDQSSGEESTRPIQVSQKVVNIEELSYSTDTIKSQDAMLVEEAQQISTRIGGVPVSARKVEVSDVKEFENERILDTSSDSKTNDLVSMKFSDAVIEPKKLPAGAGMLDKLSSEHKAKLKNDSMNVPQEQLRGSDDADEKVSGEKIEEVAIRKLESETIHEDPYNSGKRELTSVQPITEDSVDSEKCAREEVKIDDLHSETKDSEEKNAIILTETDGKEDDTAPEILQEVTPIEDGPVSQKEIIEVEKEGVHEGILRNESSIKELERKIIHEGSSTSENAGLSLVQSNTEESVKPKHVPEKEETDDGNDEVLFEAIQVVDIEEKNKDTIEDSSSSQKSEITFSKYGLAGSFDSEQMSKEALKINELSKETEVAVKVGGTNRRVRDTDDGDELICNKENEKIDIKEFESEIIVENTTSSREIILGKFSSEESIKPVQVSEKMVEMDEISSTAEVTKKQNTIIAHQTEGKSTHDDRKTVSERRLEVLDEHESKSALLKSTPSSTTKEIISVEFSQSDSIGPEMISVNIGEMDNVSPKSTNGKEDDIAPEILQEVTPIEDGPVSQKEIVEVEKEGVHEGILRNESSIKELECKIIHEGSSTSENAGLSLVQSNTEESVKPKQVPEKEVKADELTSKTEQPMEEDAFVIQGTQHERAVNEDTQILEKVVQKVYIKDLDGTRAVENIPRFEKSEIISPILRPRGSIEPKQTSDKAFITQEFHVDTKDARKDEVISLPETQQDNEDEIVSEKEMYGGEAVFEEEVEALNSKDFEKKQTFPNSLSSEKSDLTPVQITAEESIKQNLISQEVFKINASSFEADVTKREDTITVHEIQTDLQSEDDLIFEKKIEVSDVRELENEQALGSPSTSEIEEAISDKVSQGESGEPENISQESVRMDKSSLESTDVEKEVDLRVIEVQQKVIRDEGEKVSGKEIEEISIEELDMKPIPEDSSSSEMSKLAPAHFTTKELIEAKQHSQKESKINELFSKSKEATIEDAIVVKETQQKEMEKGTKQNFEEKIEEVNIIEVCKGAPENSLSSKDSELISLNLSHGWPIEPEKVFEGTSEIHELSCETKDGIKNDIITVTEILTHHDEEAVAGKEVEISFIPEIDSKQILETSEVSKKADLDIDFRDTHETLTESIQENISGPAETLLEGAKDSVKSKDSDIVEDHRLGVGLYESAKINPEDVSSTESLKCDQPLSPGATIHPFNVDGKFDDPEELKNSADKLTAQCKILDGKGQPLFSELLVKKPKTCTNLSKDPKDSRTKLIFEDLIEPILEPPLSKFDDGEDSAVSVKKLSRSKISDTESLHIDVSKPDAGMALEGLAEDDDPFSMSSCVEENVSCSTQGDLNAYTSVKNESLHSTVSEFNLKEIGTAAAATFFIPSSLVPETSEEKSETLQSENTTNLKLDETTNGNISSSSLVNPPSFVADHPPKTRIFSSIEQENPEFTSVVEEKSIGSSSVPHVSTQNLPIDSQDTRVEPASEVSDIITGESGASTAPSSLVSCSDTDPQITSTSVDDEKSNKEISDQSSGADSTSQKNTVSSENLDEQGSLFTTKSGATYVFVKSTSTNLLCSCDEIEASRNVTLSIENYERKDEAMSATLHETITTDESQKSSIQSGQSSGTIEIGEAMSASLHETITPYESQKSSMQSGQSSGTIETGESGSIVEQAAPLFKVKSLVSTQISITNDASEIIIASESDNHSKQKITKKSERPSSLVYADKANVKSRRMFSSSHAQTAGEEISISSQKPASRLGFSQRKTTPKSHGSAGSRSSVISGDSSKVKHVSARSDASIAKHNLSMSDSEPMYNVKSVSRTSKDRSASNVKKPSPPTSHPVALKKRSVDLSQSKNENAKSSLAKTQSPMSRKYPTDSSPPRKTDPTSSVARRTNVSSKSETKSYLVKPSSQSDRTSLTKSSMTQSFLKGVPTMKQRLIINQSTKSFPSEKADVLPDVVEKSGKVPVKHKSDFKSKGYTASTLSTTMKTKVTSGAELEVKVTSKIRSSPPNREINSNAQRISEKEEKDVKNLVMKKSKLKISQTATSSSRIQDMRRGNEKIILVKDTTKSEPERDGSQSKLERVNYVEGKTKKISGKEVSAYKMQKKSISKVSNLTDVKECKKADSTIPLESSIRKSTISSSNLSGSVAASDQKNVHSVSFIDDRSQGLSKVLKKSTFSQTLENLKTASSAPLCAHLSQKDLEQMRYRRKSDPKLNISHHDSSFREYRGSSSLSSSPCRKRRLSNGMSSFLTSEVFTQFNKFGHNSGSLDFLFSQPSDSLLKGSLFSQEGQLVVDTKSKTFPSGSTATSLSINPSVLPHPSDSMNVDTHNNVRSSTFSHTHSSRSAIRSISNQTQLDKLVTDDRSLRPEEGIHTYASEKKELSTFHKGPREFSVIKKSPGKTNLAISSDDESKVRLTQCSNKICEEQLSPVFQVRARTPPRVKHTFQYLDSDEEEGPGSSSDKSVVMDGAKPHPPSKKHF